MKSIEKINIDGNNKLKVISNEDNSYVLDYYI